nr:reverse transcriptase domain-containing protein [Tanacetum cinerariifolium]
MVHSYWMKCEEPDQKKAQRIEEIALFHVDLENQKFTIFTIQNIARSNPRRTIAQIVGRTTRRSNRRRIPNIVELEIRTIAEIIPMADRTMEELLQALAEGYGEAIVISEILAENFDIKTNLLQLVQANKFHEDRARIWYEKEPPNSILTWDDLVNQFFPPSKTTHFKNEISRFTQRFDETFSEAWDHFKELLRACPHHGFSELTQIDTEVVSKTDDQIDKLANQISNLVEIVNKQVITLAKTVEKTCVTCRGAHAYYECIATDSNPSSVCAATGSYNQVSPPNRASHQIPPPGFAPVQNNPNRFNQNHGQGNYFKLAKVSLNENCSAMLLKKLPEKLGDPGKFLIPCDFPRMEVCHALADLGASINLMPLSIWKKLSLPELTTTRMTLELADRSIIHPKGVVEDVFVKVGKFHFLTDFVVVDFEADPRVPLILERSFLRTGRALIDVYGEEITLRYNPKSSNPTLVFYDSISESDSSKVHIVKSSSPTLTPFRESDLFLEEIKDFLNDDSISTRIENYIYDLEGDILFLEKLLNEDPFQLPPMDLKLAEESKEKSFVEEPPELELKELPSHLEYAFLEDSNKLPVIIAKNLKDDEREALINILMEDDYKPAVQSQRRVNPKIHDVIKKEVIKLLDAGMIYHISDSPWVSPIHCVPKKGGMTVVANENNELIPTRLVIGWRGISKFLLIHKTMKKLLSHALMEPSLGLCNAPVLDKKGSENLAADHLSRLENPHQDVLENKDINENFPLETLGSLTSHSTPWKLLKFSKLSMRDLPEAIMVPISQQR